MDNFLIVGVGNILLSDDGAGIHAINRLKDRYQIPKNVEVVDGGTMGMELWTLFEDKKHLFIVDAIKTGEKPGSLHRIVLENPFGSFPARISPHQTGLVDLLNIAFLNDTLPSNIILFGIEPEHVTTGLELSTKVKNNIDKLIDMLASELISLGLPLSLGRDNMA